MADDDQRLTRALDQGLHAVADLIRFLQDHLREDHSGQVDRVHDYLRYAEERLAAARRELTADGQRRR